MLRGGLGLLAVAVVLAMFPYTPDPTGDIKLLLIGLGGAVLACAWWSSVRDQQGAAPLPRLFFPMLLLLLVLHVAAACGSSYPWLGLVTTCRFWWLFVLYVVAAYAFRTPGQIRRWALAVCLGVALASTYGFIQRAGMDFFPWQQAILSREEYTNVPATFGNPNLAAHVLVLCVILCVYLATARGTRWCLLLLPVFLVHLYLTGQRAGLVALVVAGLLVGIALLVRWREQRPVRALGTTLVVFALLVVALAGGVMLLNKSRTGEWLPLDGSLWLRYNALCSASPMVVDRPVLGWGPGAYAVENAPYWTPHEQAWYATAHKLNTHVHCDVMETAVELGLLAAAVHIALFLAGIGYALYLAFRAHDAGLRRLGYAVAAFVCCFAVDGLFGFNLRAPVSAMMLFVLLGAFDGVWASCSPKTPEQARGHNRRLLRYGAIAAGVVFLLLEVDVFASQFLLQRGCGAIHWRAYRDADVVLEKGERLAPWNGRFAFERGRAAHALGDFEEATAHLARALQRNPNDIAAMVLRSHCAMNLAMDAGLELDGKQQRLGRAAEDAERALALCPVLPEAHDVLGRVSLARADLGDAQALPEAERHLAEAVEYMSKSDPNAYYLLAHARSTLGDAGGAEDALLQAVRIDTRQQDSWANFLRLAESTGRFEAIGYELQRQIQYVKGVLMNQADPAEEERLVVLMLLLARVHEQGDGDIDAAERLYRATVRRAPERLDVWQAFAAFAERHDRQAVFDYCARKRREAAS